MAAHAGHPGRYTQDGHPRFGVRAIPGQRAEQAIAILRSGDQNGQIPISKAIGVAKVALIGG